MGQITTTQEAVLVVVPAVGAQAVLVTAATVVAAQEALTLVAVVAVLTIAAVINPLAAAVVAQAL